MNNAEVLIKFTANDDEATKKEKEQEQQLKALQKTGENVASGLAIAVDAMAAAFVGMGISYNAEIETYLTRLTTLTGSVEKANAVLDQIKQDALKTPFDVKSLTQAEALLLSTGITAEQVRDDIINLGNAISASGGGNAELQRMAVNLQQIKNVGKASALDIKQFAYAGIDVYGLLADSLGITRGEVKDLDISYEMLSNALAKASSQGGKYYGAMEAQSKTMNGAMSNLQESFQVFAGNMSEGVFNAIKDLIPQLTNMFDWLTANKDLVMAIVVPFMTFINILGGFMILKKITGLFKAFGFAMSANPIIAVIATITALVAGFMYLWNNCEGFRNFFIDMWEAIKNAVGIVVDAIVGFFQNAITNIVTMWNNIVIFFTTLWENIKAIFMVVVEWVNTTIIQPLLAIIMPIVDFIKNLFIVIIALIAMGLEAIWGVLSVVASWVYDNVISPIIAIFQICHDFIVNNIITPIVDFFTAAWQMISEGAIFLGESIKNVFNAVKDFVYNYIISPIVNFFVNAFNTIVNFIVNVATKIKNALVSAFTFVRDKVSSLFQTLAGIIKAPINAVIGAINGVLNGLNQLKIPDWVPIIGGASPNFKMIPQLNVGTNYVPDDTLAMIHKGEAVIPKKFNPYANGVNNRTIGSMGTGNVTPIVNVYAEFETDPIGQVVSKIKTFSGGAKNDFNYGQGVA